MYKDLLNNSEINNSCKSSTKYSIMKAFNKIPDSFKYNYDKLKNNAIKDLENSFKKSCYWIHDNKLEIIEFLNESKNKVLIEYKNKKSESNKIYRDKLKLELQIQDKVILTDEQRKINKQISNKIYRDKLKKELQIKDKIILTDEQRKINRQITQKKYRDKSSVALHQADNSNTNPNA
jgi:hypothetical protein